MREADAQDLDGPQDGKKRRSAARRWGGGLVLGLAGAIVLGGSAAWLSRERIARDVIDDYLASRRVPARYDIVTLTPQEQVIENLVVGDPARPDLTARRMVIELGVGWTGPTVRRITVEGARLFASAKDGSFTLGALDPLVFTGEEGQPALPELNIALIDARALVESDYGRIGVKLDGGGRLDDGFAGTLAATAPRAGAAGCGAETATLYGKLTTADGVPRFAGPLRLGELACGGASLARADIGTRLSLTKDFSAAQADFKLEGQRAAYAALTGARLDGTAQLSWTADRIALGHDLTLADVSTPQGRLARLEALGDWRGAANLVSGQWEGTIRGAGLRPSPGLTASLAAAERGAQGTLVASLLAKARGGLTRALEGADFRADATLRRKGDSLGLAIPEASIVSASGTRVAVLSRTSAQIGAGGVSGLGGNILIGGEGLPDINGRMEQQRGGGWALRMAMADFAAGTDRMAIPRLTVRAAPGGAMAFDGLMTASGILPGGGVSELTVPLDGTWSSARGLAMGTRCTPLKFARLALSGLSLDARAINLCPERAGPILVWRDGLRLAARTGPLDLAGTLGESPAVLSAANAVLRYPEPFAVEGLTAMIGTGSSEVRLSAANLTGRFGSTIAGAFDGGTARLAPVPLDLDAIAGRWAYEDGVLRVTEGALTLSDRPAEGEARFVPLTAQGATLTLADGRITADAQLAHPQSGRTVANVAIAHDLASATGSARLGVPGVIFDKRFQPEDLTYLAKGVIAFADGTITGNGRIDWRGDTITSSGTFASDGFDFAAAFGPVRGVAGQVAFTDLLNLTTAPDQRLTIASINPGVEALAGTVQFELKDATLLTLEEARFPFMGGKLEMRPLVMDFSQPEERRYVFEITGLDAATFVSQLELSNIAATGIFDGTVPIIFDANGNGRIEGGLLLSRAGGGNVAYLGELSYENLGTMGNYAFSALRSLDYTQMSVTLDGDLAGEIITSFNFDGIRQGAGTSQNFITRRLGKLPIQFRINVRSQSFSQLAMIARGMSDPSTWLDLFEDSQVREQVDRLKAARPAGTAPAPPPAPPPAPQSRP